MEATETFWRKGEMWGMKEGKFDALEQPSTPNTTIPQTPIRAQARDGTNTGVADFAAMPHATQPERPLDVTWRALVTPRSGE